MTPGEKALAALKAMFEVQDLGDFVYNVRDRGLQGWESPLAKKWGAACMLAREALKESASGNVPAAPLASRWEGEDGG